MFIHNHIIGISEKEKKRRGKVGKWKMIKKKRMQALVDQKNR
jgi:hypothetical protein